jgi:peptidoglycan/LPS O-acetylase OafA/YrhL
MPNIYFNSIISYFDVAASSNPLLHLWSLGVEEQFYLVAPLLLTFRTSAGQFL